MTQHTETFLDRIVADKVAEVEAAKASVPFGSLRARLPEAPPARDFLGALSGPGVSLIAEVKKASPSKGLLRDDFDPVALARTYAAAGAAALSVLTDEKHFQGSLAHLAAVREALPGGPPLLRKDFILDPYQVYEARYHGADAVLLIAAILDPALMAELATLAKTLGMAALVEVHNQRELERALASGAGLIGINNRDLRTFETDLAVTERLRPLVPPEVPVVSESGILTRDDLRRLAACNVQAVLIGEALVTSPDPAAKVRELFGEEH